MKYIYLILLAMLAGCTGNKTEEYISLEYKGKDSYRIDTIHFNNNMKIPFYSFYEEIDTIIINYKGIKGYIKIPFYNLFEVVGAKPAFCVDSANNVIFVYVPESSVQKYDLTTKELLEKNILSSRRYFFYNHSYELFLLNDFLVFSSAHHVLVFNKKLELAASLRETTEASMGRDLFRLYDFNTEVIGDTLLLKAIFTDNDSFYNKNKRHRYIHKDYEFIITDKIVCNNCDRTYYRESKLRTEQEMQELLNSPLYSQSSQTRIYKPLPTP